MPLLGTRLVIVLIRAPTAVALFGISGVRSSRQFQAEYQKLLTLVKALPHKRSSFFKELNKVPELGLS